MDITQILVGIILILGAVVSYFVIPFVKAKLTAQQLSILYGIAKTAVYAAEKIFGAKMGSDKLAYALGLVKRWLEAKNLHFDEDAIRAAIEEQVKHLDIEEGYYSLVEAEPIEEDEEEIINE